MIEEFKAKAEGVGAEFRRFGTVAEGIGFLLSLLSTEEISAASGNYAVCADLPSIAEPEKRSLYLAGVRSDVSRESAAAAKIGISQMEWGLADTGTLVQDQTAVQRRLVSSLPEIHVALIGAKAILPDKPALLERVDPRRSRYLAFITGPSRTADIERVLTIGVHGPKRVVIVCIDELGEER